MNLKIILYNNNETKIIIKLVACSAFYSNAMLCYL